MATLTRLALLAAICVTNLSQCSVKQNTATNGDSSLNNLRIPKESEAQNHGNQKNNKNHGKSKLTSSVGQDIYKDNYSPYKQVTTEISRRPFVQYLDASNTSTKESTRTDYSNSSSFSRLRDVYYDNREKEFVKEDGKVKPSLQNSIMSGISKRRIKRTDNDQKSQIVELYSNSERAKLIMAHNLLRQHVNPTAAGMIFMVYSLQLEKVASLWARECDQNAELPVINRLAFEEGDLGKNTGTTKERYDWDVMIAIWAKGREFYTYTTSQCRAKVACRYYITMIWAETNYLGCSSAYCPIYLKGKVTIQDVYSYACYYSPAGNTKWKDSHGTHLTPYKSGIPGSQCPSGHKHTWQNLCRTDPPCKDVRECEYPPNINTCLCEPFLYSSAQKSVLWKFLDVDVILVIVTWSRVNAYD